MAEDGTSEDGFVERIPCTNGNVCLLRISTDDGIKACRLFPRDLITSWSVLFLQAVLFDPQILSPCFARSVNLLGNIPPGIIVSSPMGDRCSFEGL
jgi:hypothetical protein